MKRAIKNRGKKVQAYYLHEDHPVIRELIQNGKIKKIGNKQYELYSRESLNGKGQVAPEGYYVRLDSSGYPYPNSPDYVKEHLRHIGGDDYEQVPSPVEVWSFGEAWCPEMEFLVRHKELNIEATDQDKYFTAPLWGTMLSASRDAKIVFYEVMYDEAGKVNDADFNFVAKDEFERTYTFI